MNLRQLATALIAVGTLAACNEIDIPNGRIPAEHKAMAEKYLGTYSGEFEGRNAQFTLSMDSENRVLMHFQDTRGNDLIAPNCGSIIGDLKQIRGDEKNGQKILKFASFDFHSGSCVNVQGEMLELFFDHKRDGSIEMSGRLLDYVEHYEDCYWDVIPGGGSRRRCTLRVMNHYLGGEFLKD